jgi:hypothetical protein
MRHEWDWPERPPTHQRRRYYRTVEYQPSGWSSPITTKIVDIYWRATLFIIKAMLSIALSIMLVGSIWLLWVLFVA